HRLEVERDEQPRVKWRIENGGEFARLPGLVLAVYPFLRILLRPATLHEQIVVSTEARSSRGPFWGLTGLPVCHELERNSACTRQGPPPRCGPFLFASA